MTKDRTMNNLIAGRTLTDWQELARRDDVFSQIVPSDLRELVGVLITRHDTYSTTVPGAADVRRAGLREAVQRYQAPEPYTDRDGKRSDAAPIGIQEQHRKDLFIADVLYWLSDD